jgi:hypothetical protein
MSTDIMRNQVAHFLLTDTSPSDVWSIIGDGITSGAVSGNPEITSETYINQAGATPTLDRYAPTMPVEGKCKLGDAAFDFINNLWKTRAIGTAAETYVLEVDLYATPTSTDNYTARKQKVVVAVDTPPGGDGGQVARISYTLHFVGDPTAGTYDVSTGAFTPTP